MSCQANFSAGREFDMIEYPGKVVNVDNMLNTLGGIKNISQSLSGDQKRLELRYHPDNPFNKCIFADRAKNTSGVLLSVKVRRSKREPTRPPQYNFSILGFCQKSFSFENLCDYQYLPLVEHTNKQSDNSMKKGSLRYDLDALLPCSASDTDYFTRTGISLFCLPQCFARSDIVHLDLLRNYNQEDGQREVLGVMQKTSNDNLMTIVSFNMVDTFPVRADPKIVKSMKIKYVSDEQLQRVRKLFEECPIWTRIALLHESGVSNDKLKCIIPSLAYYFSTGPWRMLFVRYGYDPRKDFHSRHYQMFDFRLRFRAGVSEFISNRKDAKNKKQENSDELSDLTQDINYPYLDERKLPRSRQCILRYCDIHMPKVQEMLEKIPSPLTGAMCNERTGWLPAGFDGQVRQLVSISIKELLRSHYRKEQIHADLDTIGNADQEDHSIGEEDEDSDISATNESLMDESITGVLEDMQIDSDLLS